MKICGQLPEALNLPPEAAAAVIARRINAAHGRRTTPAEVERYLRGQKRPSVAVFEKMVEAAGFSLRLEKNVAGDAKQ